MIGLRNGRAGLPALMRASFIRAQNPAQAGALQLVPPIWSDAPLRKMNAPLLGSAVRLTSGTRRFVPAGKPAPFCQSGRSKKRLTPPPLSGQATSSSTAPDDPRVRLVPPTPITNG